MTVSSIEMNEQHVVLFLEQHQHSAARLRSFWQAQNEVHEVAAYELLHALKGSANVLGDIQLDHLLNTVLFEEQQVEWRLVPGIIERLEHAFKTRQRQPLVSGDEKVQMQERLQQLIRQHNYAALEMTRNWLTLPDPPMPRVKLQRLLSCLENFDFQTAERYIGEQLTYNNN